MSLMKLLFIDNMSLNLSSIFIFYNNIITFIYSIKKYILTFKKQILKNCSIRQKGGMSRYRPYESLGQVIYMHGYLYILCRIYIHVSKQLPIIRQGDSFIIEHQLFQKARIIHLIRVNSHLRHIIIYLLCTLCIDFILHMKKNKNKYSKAEYRIFFESISIIRNNY